MTNHDSSPGRRQVLLVSPNFPPINAPDMQRARLALPYLREHGWEPVVLAVAPEFSGGVLDPLLEQTYPVDIRVVRVRGLSRRATRWAGIGSLWWRCGAALRRAGDRLLGNERFDLVFFTTTQFDAFALGPAWRRRFGVPYVLDYQDPWISPYYHKTKTRPPGGWLKFNAGQWFARRREPASVRQAAAIVTVSDGYGDDLVTRYPELDRRRITLLPFGASPADMAIAAAHPPAAPCVNFTDGNIHLVYTGRCGPDMAFALTVVFRAFNRYLASDPTTARRMRFHFIGTSYAPPPLGQESVMPIARAEGVAPFVDEHCPRVPYFDALYYLQHAGALLVLGSNDPSYTASKLFPCVLAERPMLIVFGRDSLVLKLATEVGAGVRVSFAGPGDCERVVDEIHGRWFATAGFRSQPAFNREKFRAFTAESLTARLAEIFDLAANTPRRDPP